MEEIAGYYYWASVYCVPCGEKQPETDPEGNARKPAYTFDEAGARQYCTDCSVPLDIGFYRCDLVETYPVHYQNCAGGDVCNWTPDAD